MAKARPDATRVPSQAAITKATRTRFPQAHSRAAVDSTDGSVVRGEPNSRWLRG
jgi:hypothetical protein